VDVIPLRDHDGPGSEEAYSGDDLRTYTRRVSTVKERSKLTGARGYHRADTDQYVGPEAG
jgi:hypothetical protein